MRKEELPKVLGILKREFRKWNAPVGRMMRTHGGEPFRVLVCALLSTRTRDDTTREACERLFSRAKSPEELLQLTQSEIERLIYPVGFYRTKAKQLKEIARVLSEEFGGRVPDTLEELLRLPGVGRKVANLVLSKGFGKPAVVVDVHVHRITNRWCLIKTKTPEETERKLMEILPPELWGEVNYLLVAFGQSVCLPKKPLCHACPIESYCSKCF
ncbi:MAG: endonuclease III [Aquificae bacterium]|nr:endonuclease III [Aquificota bacterium]